MREEESRGETSLKETTDGGSALSSRVARGRDVGGDFHRWALLEHVALLLIFSLSKQRSFHDLKGVWIDAH